MTISKTNNKIVIKHVLHLKYSNNKWIKITKIIFFKKFVWKQWTMGRGGERVLRISVLIARHDDDIISETKNSYQGYDLRTNRSFKEIQYFTPSKRGDFWGASTKENLAKNVLNAHRIILTKITFHSFFICVLVNTVPVLIYFLNTSYTLYIIKLL